MTKNGLKALFSILQFLIALVILILLSSPALNWYDKSFSAMDVIGGFSNGTGSNLKIVAEFSFLNLLPYLLLAICLIGVFLKYAFNIFDNKITRIIIIVLYITIGIMLLLSKYMLNKVNNTGVIYDLEYYSVAGGAITQAIIAFICAGLGVADLLIKAEIEDEPLDDNEVNDLKNEYINLLKEQKENDNLEENNKENEE